jgi:predicted hotdog family 3-hydroxylacyl-ACP dehydratase
MSRPTERFPDGKALAAINQAMIGDDGVACLMAAAPEMAAALRAMIYDTTHFSAVRDDGSHDCRIGAEALANARAALVKAGVDQVPCDPA